MDSDAFTHIIEFFLNPGMCSETASMILGVFAIMIRSLKALDLPTLVDQFAIVAAIIIIIIIICSDFVLVSKAIT
ncbi:hypothetical protein OIU79_003120 [Salix purpurea]|uniref:Uncharacterized protein n=1 Tax=Salix purpurea TaxID=77065 RepID=A0A9Q0UKP2_SALPP|nr:hypothetical protein OIU79_003120 [Salix purpurea]